MFQNFNDFYQEKRLERERQSITSYTSPARKPEFNWKVLSAWLLGLAILALLIIIIVTVIEKDQIHGNVHVKPYFLVDGKEMSKIVKDKSQNLAKNCTK
jgi:hypothetical protein